MSDEASVKDRFNEVEGLGFYGILRLKSEIRKKGNDPKYTDKAEATVEIGFTASSLEELKARSRAALDHVLISQAKALGIEKQDIPQLYGHFMKIGGTLYPLKVVVDFATDSPELMQKLNLNPITLEPEDPEGFELAIKRLDAFRKSAAIQDLERNRL